MGPLALLPLLAALAFPGPPSRTSKRPKPPAETLEFLSSPDLPAPWPVRPHTIWAEYKDRPIASKPQSLQPSNKPLTKFESLRRALEVADYNTEEDELERFLNGTPTPISGTPLQWWTREEQRIEYPRLHQMAIDILSIPPLSDKIECVFSGVRRATPWERGSLNMETIQIQELMGNWNKNGLLHEDEYVNELLLKATAVVEKADKRQDIDIDFGNDEIRPYEYI